MWGMVPVRAQHWKAGLCRAWRLGQARSSSRSLTMVRSYADPLAPCQRGQCTTWGWGLAADGG